MTRFATLALTPALVVLSASAFAAPVTLLPGDINGSDTNTTVFNNGEVTMTAERGGVATSFNGNANRLGIDDAGTGNVNAFSDVDGIQGGADQELLIMDFTATSGLTQIGWDFSRGTVEISGFASDPGASLSGAVANATAPVYNAGTLSFFLAGADFGGTDGFLNLSNAAASAGQTLTLDVFDAGQAGPQLAITTISYDNAVPEPSSLALIGLGGLLIARRRRG